MDRERIDALTRSSTGTHLRRGVIAALFGVALLARAPLAGPLAVEAAEGGEGGEGGSANSTGGTGSTGGSGGTASSTETDRGRGGHRRKGKRRGKRRR
jgi:hypothetical protein